MLQSEGAIGREMDTHLVIGASGLIGGQLLRSVTLSGFDAVGTYHSHAVPGARQLDIRDPSQVGSLVAELRPSTVYLAAALGNADYCELHPKEGYATNVTGTRNVVQAANRAGAKLVYFSTDYVFDGKSGPYREEDTLNPICEYGRQKLIAEHHISLYMRDYVIVRTTVVYGWERQRKNFVCRLLDTLKKGQELKAPVDQVGSPTYAPNLVEAVLGLVASEAQGAYHVVGHERVSRYEFAREAARVFGLSENLIQPVTTRELSQIAPRPLNAGMLIDKVEAKLQMGLLGYREGLRTMARDKEEMA